MIVRYALLDKFAGAELDTRFMERYMRYLVVCVDWIENIFGSTKAILINSMSYDDVTVAEGREEA